jgi:hypothetical protein
MTPGSYFKDRNLVIVTKHAKEKVIAPLLESELEMSCFVSRHVDTDTLGTFSGEIERESDPIATLRKKCHLGIKAHGCDIAVASEGSFGPHPTVFFAPADEEIIMLLDTRNNLEVVAKVLSTETNFDGKTVRSESELLQFAETTQFPSHRLILKKSQGEKADIVKGIGDLETLLASYRKFKAESDDVHVETDMRAMYNPKRMKVIESATKKLIENLKSTCPVCSTPGFVISASIAGLPCDLCGSPTRSTLSYLYHCSTCKHNVEKKYPHEKFTEDPMYCDLCNP